ncbi:MAG: tetratricopeptide repeat protein [Pirellula sp.]|nr:tetratricopeptide repeat protein [Pirellula sp.]
MWKSIREFPLTLLRGFSDGLERALSAIASPLQGRSDEDDDRPQRPWWSWLWLFPFLLIYWLFWGGLAAITFPVRALFLPKSSRNCYLRGLPAFGLMLIVVGLIATHLYFSDRLVDRYRSRVATSLSQNETSQGVLYARRLVSQWSDAKRENVYFYGMAHAQANDMEVASVSMARIAPDDEPGFAPAHFFRAFELIQQLESHEDDSQWKTLRWHLEQSGSREDERLLVMWARFYQAQAEWDQAADALKEAGRMNPVHFLALAGLEEQRANTTGANKALDQAREGFEDVLAKDPTNKLQRLQLAMTYNKLKRFAEAERLLLAGTQLHRDPEMRRATAEFYLLRFDDAPADAPIAVRLSYLTSAMTLDLNYPDIYKRLASLFDPSLSDEQKSELRKSLEQLLVSGNSPSVAHFALGCLAGLSSETGSQASWHLSQAQALQPVIAVAYNNFAQVLMGLDPPRLDEAEIFASLATTGSVQAVALYVTLGKVLVAKQEWAEAIEVLVPVAAKYPDSKEIHSLLATAYEATGDLEKAAVEHGLAESQDESTGSR